MKPEKSSRLTQTDPRLCLILEYMRQRPKHGEALQRDCLSEVLLAEEERIQRDPLGTGLSRVSKTDGEKQGSGCAICNLREETGNVDKLHASREKTLHVQKFRTAEVTICIIPERTARSQPDSYRTLGFGTRGFHGLTANPLCIRKREPDLHL